MKMTKYVNVGFVLVGLVLSSHAMAASANQGAIIAPETLAAADRTKLEQAIAADRVANPAAFDAIARLHQDLPALDAEKRGRAVPVASILKTMGANALLPMLNEIAFRGHERNGFTDSAWKSWRVGLVEAVGFLRDTRSAPVLVAILDGAENDYDVIRAAAGALGKLGTDAAAQKLVSMARQKSPKQLAVLAGMGHCRRKASTEALAAALRAGADAQTAKIVAESLGDAGSAWAWKTPVVASSGEENAVRSTAAKALIASYLRYEGATRAAIGKAVLIVDHPDTLALIEAQKRTAQSDGAALLDELAARFKSSPLHR